MWEVFHLGSAMPYHNILGGTKIIEFLRNGHRLSKPELCPQYIYDIMLECWQERHLTRPTFLQLKSQLKSFLPPSSQGFLELRYSGTPHDSNLELLDLHHGSNPEITLQYSSIHFTKESNQSSNLSRYC